VADESDPTSERFLGMPVQKTAIIGVGTRSVQLAAYTGTVLYATEYQFKCVAAGAGCTADSAGTTVSGLFNEGKSSVFGFVEGLEPDTSYDCYVITNKGKCGKAYSVQTKPVAYVPTSNVSPGIVLACNIFEAFDFSSDSSIGECIESEITVAFNPFATVAIQGGKAFVSEATEVDVCDITESGTKLTNCQTALDLQVSQVYGFALQGNNAYVVGKNPDRSFGGDTIGLFNVLSNGSFVDGEVTGPTFNDDLKSLYIQGSTLYAVGENITACSIITNGSLTDCNLAYVPGDAGIPSRMIINGGNAYVTYPEKDQVSLCSVKSDGSLTDCSATGYGFDSPSGIAILGDGAYISQLAGYTVTCSVLSNGEFTNCDPTSVYDGTDIVL
jgi:hypothetical protein